VTFRVLRGDVNADAAVNDADLAVVKSAVGKPVDGSSFRNDLNANAAISGADVNLAKAAATGAANVAGEATTNTPPTITSVPNQQAVTGVASTPAGSPSATPNPIPPR
jgi:hypothetical protein